MKLKRPAEIVVHPSAPAAPKLDERERLIWMLEELQRAITDSGPGNPSRITAIKQYDEMAARLAAIDEAAAADLDDEAAYLQWCDELHRMPTRWIEAAVLHYCDLHGLELKPAK